MPGDPREQLAEKYERNGWPAEARPDLTPPDGWSIPLIMSVRRPRSHVPSQDGRFVAFYWDLDDASDLYVLPTTGGWPSRITFDRDPAPFWFDDPPQWSPDGQWLAFTNQGHVWVVPSPNAHFSAPPGRLPWKVTDFTTGADTPRWMPDSNGLLITVYRERRTRILLPDGDGWGPRQNSWGDGHDHSPVASPDGRYVAYIHQPLDDLNRTDLTLADLANSDEISLLSGTPSRHNYAPKWSADSKRIAFISDRPGFYELFMIDVETRQERQVTHAGHDLGGLSWSPDGTRLACTINREGQIDLAIIDAASGEISDLRTAAGVHARPHWLPEGQAITFEYEDYCTPLDLYRIDIGSKQVTQLTYSNPPALAAVDMVAPERVSYHSFDGLEIPAFLFRPKKPNGAAILYPHGGPTGQYVPDWDGVIQYFVAKGYTWICPNFRGSTGYGVEFTRANFGVWGIDDARDCMAGADYLISLGIDPNRIAIFGASYGSYLAICALANDPKDRFACGIGKYGDCDILTSWAQASQGAREDLERMMRHPSQNREAYRLGSPVWNVANIRKPLLIVHGLHDPIVHPLQSEELVEALRREGKTYEYVTYGDEGHGLLRRKNRIDFHERLERFIDWYLI